MLDINIIDKKYNTKRTHEHKTIYTQEGYACNNFFSQDDSSDVLYHAFTVTLIYVFCTNIPSLGKKATGDVDLVSSSYNHIFILLSFDIIIYIIVIISSIILLLILLIIFSILLLFSFLFTLS